MHRFLPKTAVYVAQGIDGLVKVGLTADPDGRKNGIAIVFRGKGDRLEHFQSCADVADPYEVEDALIRFCHTRYKRHSGFEWFVGDGDFDALVAAMVRIVDEIAADAVAEFPTPTPEQIRAWQIRDARELRLKAERIANYARKRASRLVQQSAVAQPLA